jgi:uncharacterized membrane protein YtjA (UPF0391 family)
VGTRSIAAGTAPAAKILFTIFVDAIFTTLFERSFTKRFDYGRETTAASCV